MSKALSTLRHTKITNLSLVLKLVTRCTDVSKTTPWTSFVFLMDRSSCGDCWHPPRASGLMHSLRLELWARAEGCTAESSEGTLEGNTGPQTGRPHKQEIFSGCQTSLLSQTHIFPPSSVNNHWGVGKLLMRDSNSMCLPLQACWEVINLSELVYIWYFLRGCSNLNRTLQYDQLQVLKEADGVIMTSWKYMIVFLCVSF